MKPRRRLFSAVSAALAVALGGALRAEEADTAKPDAAKTADERDAEILALGKRASVLKSGKATYVSLCQTCHADAKATGDSPSNLFDAKWYHGGRPSEIEHTIQTGVIEKGMPPWGPVLPPEDTAAVTAYILSLQKTS